MVGGGCSWVAALAELVVGDAEGAPGGRVEPELVLVARALGADASTGFWSRATILINPAAATAASTRRTTRVSIARRRRGAGGAGTGSTSTVPNKLTALVVR